ncbi:SseB family protein [Paracoccus pacificus]|uniref:SseB family protein n=1 Tax=Paracoccus pacificus TaxID=1463598 RepID=A0ABW4RBL9_9RHOB
MTETTALDALCSQPFATASDSDRARILSRLADTPLFAALGEEPAGDTVTFRIFDLADGPFALAFDVEERLSTFLGGPADFVELPGRVLAGRLGAADTGILINPGHPSEMMLPAETLRWLAQTLSQAPLAAEGQATQYRRPVAPALVEPLSVRLADMAGLARAVWLVGSRFQNDTGAGHLLLVEGAAPAQQDRIAKALAETLAFLPEVPGGVDIAFTDRVPAAVAKLGLCFELPRHEVPSPVASMPPGSDPDRPPRLR